ncbi:hypothetical protein CgunFtcFv8_013506 [Champsocephalus gunnari]|uniref:Uncharacterized protein n=1 Tax=Champsocephalus gunnari TaxID=52237 RepID=A0AAN8CVQ3_CHAGU|nr:hypothetical protein CgunFtcFv8_018553 [Champsocephalus gunnari]KAK5893846.1 hypothetical protein CgunFtcFv8_006680 [Champsocephalus gunnari]KAK5907993.1 hypothetical protein CgunFtcFv8_016088 [Champsocephalus gunnari]KAK5928443.1 hypothetical protein CgunFtcFv8_013506 [Champsocephalus gunnari]
MAGPAEGLCYLWSLAFRGGGLPNTLAVDDSGMAGMDRVDSLAECLVELRNQLTMVLSNQQVSCSVAEPAGL